MSRQGKSAWLGVFFAALYFVAPACGQFSHVVSVSQLRNRVPPKAATFLKKALASSPKQSSLAELRKSLQDPVLAPFAWKALGIRHLNDVQFAEAVSAFAKAVQLLPWDTETLGLNSLALYASGAGEAGESMARRTLVVDRKNSAANLVAGLRLLDRNPTPGLETLVELSTQMHYASAMFPGARLILWHEFRAAGRIREAAGYMHTFLEDLYRLPPEEQERFCAWILRHRR